MFRTVPATLVFILLSGAGFMLVYLDAPWPWLARLTFTGFVPGPNGLIFLNTEGEYWRWLTPIFLHFHWLHLVFNCLWLWELGALLERRLGTSALIVVVVLSGIGSNYLQFRLGGAALFGGMSGVVYALLGFCWLYHRLRPQAGLAVAPGIVMFMLVWLLLGFSGIFSALGAFNVANYAHLGGLLMGLLLAAVIPARAGIHKRE